MATALVLVRHGETDWNRQRRYQGHADTPLNEAGRDQARELARRLDGEPLSAVYTSPLRRASETADILAGTLGMPVRPLEALCEIDVGAWQGLTVDEVKEQFPERANVGWRAGWAGGETYEQLGARVVPALIALGEDHPGERVLGVTHAGPIRAALAFAMGVSHEEARRLIGPLGNCSMYRFALRDGILERVD